ncbi:MAG: hypothetical protein ACHQE5_01500 [Actinomycetes bacterium]
MSFGGPTFDWGQLSDSTAHPWVPIYFGWSQSDDSGICVERGSLHHSDSTGSGWTSVPIGLGQQFFHFQAQVGGSYLLKITETDCAAPSPNTGTTTSPVAHPRLVQSNHATQVGPGWSTSTCRCWSQRLTLHSTTQGAFIAQDVTWKPWVAIAIVGDQAPGRGTVAFNWGPSISEASPTKANMVIVESSNFLEPGTGTPPPIVMTAVNANGGRIDIDAFLIMSGSY